MQIGNSCIIFLGSGTSDDSNYESLTLYEEIDDFYELTNGNDEIEYASISIEKYKNIPRSILRPPDISDIFHRLYNENNIISNSLDCSSKLTITDGISPPIIPRPRVSWPLRKVTFGK